MRKARLTIAGDPDGPEYVALGSSFASGIGLGTQADGVPVVRLRTDGGYPSLLARKLGLRLVDASMSGATTAHLFRGGAYRSAPQIEAVSANTRLVTITAGGNDVAYTRDLMLLAGIGTLRRRLYGKLLWRGPEPAAARDFAAVRANFVRAGAEVKRRAPGARLVLVTYPAILPPTGTCEALGFGAESADIMREVAARLAEITAEAAAQSGALLVDMHALSQEHHACAGEPWANGATRPPPFHPTRAGASAAAEAIARIIAPLR